MRDYTFQACTTINNGTKNKTYYLKADGGIFKRVSKDSFETKEIMADRWECLHTVTKGQYTRHYMTLVFDTNSRFHSK